MYIYVYMYICIIDVYMYIYIDVYMYICIHVYMYVKNPSAAAIRARCSGASSGQRQPFVVVVLSHLGLANEPC